MSIGRQVLRHSLSATAAVRARGLLATDPLGLGNIDAALTNLATAITVPFIVPYAVAGGAADWQIGLLTAMPLLALNLSQVPGARWSGRTARPRAYLLGAGALGCAAWLALALLLLLGRADFLALLLVISVAAVSGGLLHPLWTSLLGERVPHDRRGGYFGTRNLLGGIAAMVGAFLAASLVSSMGLERGNGVALLVAVLAGTGALAAQVVAIGSGWSRRSGWGVSSPRRDLEGWRTPAARSYIVYGSLLILGAGMATPFYYVHFINRLGGSPQTATRAVAVANGMVRDRSPLPDLLRDAGDVVALLPVELRPGAPHP